MKRDRYVGDHNSSEMLMDKLSRDRRAPKVGFALLLLLYVAAYVMLVRATHTQGVVTLFGSPTPIALFAGVFSSLGNFCIIFLVVSYGAPGFYTALAILLLQFPMLFIQAIGQHNLTSIPGIFSNGFAVLVVCLIYNNSRRSRKYQSRLRDQAVTDRLTGLPNKFACSELINELLERREPFAVVSIDLNHFKAINNTMGRNTGNRVLAEVAERWKKAVQAGGSGTDDFIACQGGVEFALVIRGYRSEADLRRSIDYYNAVLEEKLTLDGCDYYITARYGYAEYPADTADGDTLLTYAFTAMYEAKRTGVHICRFTPDLLQTDHTLEIERKIRTALESETLCFYLQPQFDISHKLRGFEALARLKDGGRQFHQPRRIHPRGRKGRPDRQDRPPRLPGFCAVPWRTDQAHRGRPHAQRQRFGPSPDAQRLP